MKKILLCTALMSIMLFSGGCGRRTVTVPTVDGDTGTATEQAAGSGGTLAEQLGAEESWEEELALNGKDVNMVDIQAAVSVPDTDHMCVLTMKANPFTGEKKKALLEAVCDDIDSIYVFEDDAWPEWYAKQVIDDANYKVAAMLRIKEEFPDDFDENYEEELRTWQEYLEEYKRRNVTKQGRKSEDYQEDSYYGIRDGRNIMIDFDEDEGWASWYIYENFGSLTVKEGIDELAEIRYNGEKIVESENLCSMSEEQAVQAAEDFLEDIGYSGYGVYAVKSLRWLSYKHPQREDWTDGYSITFTRNVDGIMQEVDTFFNLPSSGDYSYDSSMSKTRYGLEQIEICINDKGILDCDIRYPYSVEEVSASPTSLISYEQVQGVFRDILQNEPDRFSFYGNPLNFNSMDLIYFRVADTEGDTYALLPVWMLSYKESNDYLDITCEYALMINAIDGSRVDFVGELYELTNE